MSTVTGKSWLNIGRRDFLYPFNNLFWIAFWFCIVEKVRPLTKHLGRKQIPKYATKISKFLMVLLATQIFDGRKTTDVMKVITRMIFLTKMSWWIKSCRNHAMIWISMPHFVLLKELIISQWTSLYMLWSSLPLNIYAKSVKNHSGIFSKLNINHILEHLVIWNSTKTSKLFSDHLFNDCTLSLIMVLSPLSYTTEGSHIDEDCDLLCWQTTCLLFVTVTLVINRNIPCRDMFPESDLHYLICIISYSELH